MSDGLLWLFRLNPEGGGGNGEFNFSMFDKAVVVLNISMLSDGEINVFYRRCFLFPVIPV